MDRKLHLVTSLVVLYLTVMYSGVSGQTRRFSFEDIYNTTVRGFSARWIDGTDDYLYRNTTTGNLMRYNASAHNETIFIDAKYFTDLSTTYYLSHDYQYALFAIDVKWIWRHSFNATYRVLNITSKEVMFFPNGPLNNSVLQYAGWGPDNSLTFVHGNNLHYQRDLWSPSVGLTTTGDITWVYNGIPDWLYEEDVFGDRIAHYYSPSGRYILYAEFNDTGIPLQPWPWYGPKTNVYTDTLSVPYPKAGDVRNGMPGPNPKVTLYVVDTHDPGYKKTHIPTFDALKDIDHYYTQAVWRDDETVMVTWTNRVQNSSWAGLYNVTHDSPTPNLNHELHITDGWVEVPPADVWFIHHGDHFLTILPKNVSASSGHWRHLAVVTSPSSGPGNITFLSSEEVEEVTAIVGFDEATSTVYYISTGGDPAERHLFSVFLNNTHRQCWTCHHGPETCRYVTASFSSTFHYYVLGCRGPDVPNYSLRNAHNVADVKILEDNSALQEKLSHIAMPTREFVNITLSDGRWVRAEVFYPPNFDAGKKYPVLVYTYAGPGSQRVMKTYPLGGSTTNWLTYMKSTHEAIVISVDGRGTAAAGDKFKFEIYRKLGTVEIMDQIDAARSFSAAHPYVDTSLPLAIFGWSYGGFTTAHALSTPGTSFGCGISVAPTTSKAYYDTAYTERYMGLATPDDNAAGYDATDVMNKVNNFHNHTFLVAHGTADDNVHWMHTGQLIRSLSAAGVLFRQNVYLDEDHGIGTRSQNRHLFLSLTDFLLNGCWPNRHQSSDTTTVNPNTSGTTRLMTSLSGVLLIVLVPLFNVLHLSTANL